MTTSVTRHTKSGYPIGIDLGTTFSAAATLDSRGTPVAIGGAEDGAKTPSVVLFERDAAIVGAEAVKLAAFERERVVLHAKRYVGSANCGRDVCGVPLPPEVVEAVVLAKLKSDVEKAVGPTGEIVIAVPSHFNEPQRKATQDAARLAGLEVSHLLNEPVAAALAHGAGEGFFSRDTSYRRPEKVLVFDLGGGSFDAAVLQLSGRECATLATAGDARLGGLDWDNRLVRLVAGRFAEEHGFDPRQEPAALVQLAAALEKARRSLSSRKNTTIEFEHRGRFFRAPFSREKLDAETKDLLGRARLAVRRLLHDAQVDWPDVSRVLLAGGASRMPMVREMLARESGGSPEMVVLDETAVAFGAAICAGFFHAGRSEIARFWPVARVVNVSTYDLGVLATEPGTGRLRRKIILPRRTTLPAAAGRRFVTKRHGQRTVEVKIVEGGDDDGQNAATVGKCVITDLPSDMPAGSTVDVFFQYEENGRLGVRARLKDADREVALFIRRNSGLSEQQLCEWEKRIRKNRFLPAGTQESEEFTLADRRLADRQDEESEVFFGEDIGAESVIPPKPPKPPNPGTGKKRQ